MSMLPNQIHYGGSQLWFGTKWGGDNPLSQTHGEAKASRRLVGSLYDELRIASARSKAVKNSCPFALSDLLLDRAANLIVKFAGKEQVRLDDDILEIASRSVGQGISERGLLHREKANRHPADRRLLHP